MVSSGHLPVSPWDGCQRRIGLYLPRNAEAKTAKLIKGSKLIVYEDAPHPLPLTHRERLIADMLAFMSA